MQLTPVFDACIDAFCAETLHFSPGWEQGPDKQKYINALAQLRLSTRQGGGGLAAASDVWPCALMASINSFARWLENTPQKLIKLQAMIANLFKLLFITLLFVIKPSCIINTMKLSKNLTIRQTQISLKSTLEKFIKIY